MVPAGPSELDFLGLLPTLQMLRRKDANFRVVLARTWHAETTAMTVLRDRLQPKGLLFATRIAERRGLQGGDKVRPGRHRIRPRLPRRRGDDVALL
jgi:hypothetical protein